MKLELQSVANFLTHLLTEVLTKEEQDRFQAACEDFLTRRFQSSWDPEKPWRGSGYRALRLNAFEFEPVISQICLMSHLSIAPVQRALGKFPCVLFTDPLDVSYKMEDGPLISLYSKGDQAWQSKTAEPL